MQKSDVFLKTAKDAPTRFWSAYERMEKQHDDEFLEKYNGDMDVLLISVSVVQLTHFFQSRLNQLFEAGLFSTINTAFILNMESTLRPNPTDTTNALLEILINQVNNDTMYSNDTSLPVWNGTDPIIILIQSIAYMSLSTSLLAAFGAVLGKQWLSHYKTSRFGRGALHERCTRRQQKLDGMKRHNFNTIMIALPTLPSFRRRCFCLQSLSW